jgi:hypothetical protein
MWGRPSVEQLEVIRGYVKGERVHDLGAGDGALANEIARLGATEVVALDVVSGAERRPHARVTRVYSDFAEYADSVDVAFVSWPVQYAFSLADITARARLVVYLGKNTDGTSCGPEVFWMQMVKRQVLAHAPEFLNTLIVYGAPTLIRPRLPEEIGALDKSRWWSYDELHARTEGEQDAHRTQGNAQG